MTFRDDHDAAIARAEALEVEVSREKAEREKLEAKVAQLEQDKAVKEVKRARREEVKAKSVKPPKQRPGSDSEPKLVDGSRKNSWIGGAILVAIILGVMVAVLASDCNQHAKIDEWDAKDKQRRNYAERWSDLTSIAPCMRMIAYDAMQVRRSTPDRADPRKTYVTIDERIAGNCLHGADAIAKDPKTTARSRTALQTWLGVQHALDAPVKALASYYSNSDWKEDNFAGAPALWQPVLALIDKQVQAVAGLRRDGLPDLDAEIRADQKTHEAKAGRDEIWWRVELAMQLHGMCDRGYDAAGIYAGRDADHAAGQLAIQQPMAALLAALKDAPIELRRIVRKVDYLTEPIAAGRPYGGETPLWHLCNLEGDLIGPAHGDVVPGMPPDPGPRPEEPSD